MTPSHINPSTDTTINPVVIDDSYRERKRQQPPQEFDKVWRIHGSTLQKVMKALRNSGNRDIANELEGDAIQNLAEVSHTPSHPPEAQQRIDAATDALKDLQITAGLLYEFCEWFCDYDCEEKPCKVTVSQLHERLEGIKTQMETHPEYLAKWNEKRAEAIALLQAGLK